MGLSNSAAANPTLNASSTVTYILNVLDGFGCSISDTVNISVNPEILADAGRDTTMCLGDSIRLGGNPSGSGGSGILSYNWSPNQNLNSNTSANPTCFAGTAISYFLVVSDPTGCSVRDTISIIVDTLRPSGILMSGPLQFCANDSITLTAYPGSGTFLWSTGETTPAIVVTQSGNYSVQINQYCGTTSSQPVTITVWANPVANFSANPLSANVGTPIQFTDLSTGPVANWNWSFGDLFSSTQQHPVHVYNEAGKFTVILIVTSPEGCSDTATMERYLEIYLNSTLFFPNVFSPNGDGLNDLFGGVGVNIDEFHMTVFDRWGKEIFKSDNFSQLWDGKMNGRDVPEGVYVFYVNARMREGGEVNRAGSVTLIR